MATAAQLTAKKCEACEGGIPKLPEADIPDLLTAIPGWRLTAGGQRIARDWKAKDFVSALDFFNRVGKLAEDEGHHPDLHLVGYKNVTVAVWTHAVNGLTENDFILAAKIDALDGPG